MAHKAIVITEFWAKVLGTLITAAVIGGFAAYADQKVYIEKVQSLEKANLPERLTRIESKVDEVLNRLDK